jgi:hypothetical protein
MYIIGLRIMILLDAKPYNLAMTTNISGETAVCIYRKFLCPEHSGNTFVSDHKYPIYQNTRRRENLKSPHSIRLFLH